MHKDGAEAQLAEWDGLLSLAQSRREQLLTWLVHQAKADGYTPLTLSQVLGISLGYLYRLYTGERSIACAGKLVYAELAQYLGQPQIIVRCMAGDIRFEDFFTDESLEQAARTVYEKLPSLADTLTCAPAGVQAFAGIVAGLDIPSRRRLRNLVIDGPAALSLQ